MTTAAEKIEQHLDAVRQLKESRGGEDLPPIVDVWRDDRILATGFAPYVDRDEGLKVANGMIMSCRPDAVTFTVDAHVTNQAINPATGEKWGPGEMQRACDDANACETGVITDTMFTTVVTPDGVIGFGQDPYHVHKSDGTVAWSGRIVEADREDMHLEGLVTDTLLQSFRDAERPLPEELRVLVDERGWQWLAAIGLLTLIQHDVTVLLSEELANVVKEVSESLPFSLGVDGLPDDGAV